MRLNITDAAILHEIVAFAAEATDEEREFAREIVIGGPGPDEDGLTSGVVAQVALMIAAEKEPPAGLTDGTYLLRDLARIIAQLDAIDRATQKLKALGLLRPDA
jgi:hypothetical protein